MACDLSKTDTRVGVSSRVSIDGPLITNERMTRGHYNHHSYVLAVIEEDEWKTTLLNLKMSRCHLQLHDPEWILNSFSNSAFVFSLLRQCIMSSASRARYQRPQQRRGIGFCDPIRALHVHIVQSFLVAYFAFQSY